jgi:hypothetical protein
MKYILIIAFEFLWFVLTIGVWDLFPWAVVESISLWGHIVVQVVVSGSVIDLKDSSEASEEPGTRCRLDPAARSLATLEGRGPMGFRVALLPAVV